MVLFNLPNSFTLLRILLIPVFTYLFLKGEYHKALIVFVLTGFTDVIDGALARIFNKKTTLGAILDPAADKLLMLVTFIALTYKELIPLWLTFLVIFRDILIVSGVFLLKRLKRKLYFKPTRLSKLNTFSQLLLISLCFTTMYLFQEQASLYLAYEAFLGKILQIIVYFVAVMTFASGVQYTRIGIMILKGSREYANLPLKKNQVSP